MAKFNKSFEFLARAKNVIPGGTNSAARQYLLGEYRGIPIEYPIFLENAKGSHIYDVDGNEFIDYNCGFGPVILGHAHPKVNEAVKAQLDKGTVFGMGHETELKLSEKMVKHIPCADMVTIMNTGSEVTSSVIRIARIQTGKEKVVKFYGHYHGWHDWATFSLTAGGGEGVFAGGKAVQPGIPTSLINDVIVLPWNNFEVVEKVLKRLGHEIAAVICEPYQCNGGVIPPEEGYLEGLRKITQEQDILLVFDEVITGFRLGLQGAQGMFKVTPDLATFSKSMANGFTIAAFAGKKSVLEPVSGRAWVYGTFNSNPISTTAALATITELEIQDNYRHLYNVCRILMNGLKDAIQDTGIKAIVQGPGPCFSIFFTDLEKITEYSQIKAIKMHPHIRRCVVFYREMLNRGVFIMPYEGTRIYLSMAHTEEDVNKTIEAAEEAFKKAKDEIQ